jgi:hypothetical protein
MQSVPLTRVRADPASSRQTRREFFQTLADSKNCWTDTGSCPATRLTSSVTMSHSPTAMAV